MAVKNHPTIPSNLSSLHWSDLACSIINDLAKQLNVNEFVAIKRAHLVGSYWSGASNLSLLNHLSSAGATFAVPTTLNATSACIAVNSISTEEQQLKARNVVKLLENMGAEAILTCAPYHLISDLEMGDSIAWAESNAVVYANSLIGARTNKTPQYIDMMASLSGYMPKYGYYDPANRQPTVAIDCHDTSVWQEIDYQLFGLWLGQVVSGEIPLIKSHQSPSIDQLRAVGANASTSGDVALFHWPGYTAEASKLDYCTPDRHYHFTKQAHAKITQQYCWQGEAIDMIMLGTPHASIHELSDIISLLKRYDKRTVLPLVISTSRYNLTNIYDIFGTDIFHYYGIEVITDACTYYRGPYPFTQSTHSVLTTSGKWAYYGRLNLQVTTKLASLEDCIRLAVGEFR